SCAASAADLFFRVLLAFAGGDQAPQAAVDVGTPGVGADLEALVFWDQTKVREANLCFAPLLGDLKTDFRVLPLGLVLSEIEVVIENTPDDFLARRQFGYLYAAAMGVFV